MTPTKTIFSLALIIAGCAALVTLWPLTSYGASSYPEIAGPKPQPETPKQFSILAHYFDRDSLPDPQTLASATDNKPEPPPPDPMAPLRQYQFLGMAASDGQIAGLFAKDGNTQILRPGDILEEFTLVELNENEARFENNELEFRLNLTNSQ